MTTDSTPFEPLRAGSLRFGGGFTLPAASGAGERILAILRAAGFEPEFDPEVDEQIADEACPSCGRKLSDVAVGHAWSLDLGTQTYQCSDPPYMGGPTTFAMGSVEIRLEDLSVLPLEPDDIILVRLPGRAYEHDIVRAREHVKKHLPGHEVLVIPADVELAAIRPPRIDIVEPSADSLRFFAPSEIVVRELCPKPPTVEELCVNNQDFEYFRTLFSTGKAMFWGQPIPPDTPVMGLPTVPAGHVRVRADGRDYLITLPPKPDWKPQT